MNNKEFMVRLTDLLDLELTGNAEVDRQEIVDAVETLVRGGTEPVDEVYDDWEDPEDGELDEEEDDAL
ncbi:MAG: hypothetical protein EXR62_08035 [Chloroflexi bacterium]|nr:hypothetical protein [Chloroflexota bacterium]